MIDFVFFFGSLFGAVVIPIAGIHVAENRLKHGYKRAMAMADARSRVNLSNAVNPLLSSATGHSDAFFFFLSRLACGAASEKKKERTGPESPPAPPVQRWRAHRPAKSRLPHTHPAPNSTVSTWPFACDFPFPPTCGGWKLFWRCCSLPLSPPSHPLSPPLTRSLPASSASSALRLFRRSFHELNPMPKILENSGKFWKKFGNGR